MINGHFPIHLLLLKVFSLKVLDSLVLRSFYLTYTGNKQYKHTNKHYTKQFLHTMKTVLKDITHSYDHVGAKITSNVGTSKKL